VPIFPLGVIARRAGDKRANVTEQQPIKRDAGLSGEFQDSAAFLPTRQGIGAKKLKLDVETRWHRRL
jgi:hypothetical protein